MDQAHLGVNRRPHREARALLVAISWLGFAAALAPVEAGAQSLDDLELRKRKVQPAARGLLGFGWLSVFETSVGLNRDRPELTSLVLLAPQLKVGDKLRLRLNLGGQRGWLARQEDPWDLTDFSLQVSHLGLYREPRSGVLLSGYLRYYLPTSKASRQAGSYGQLRLLGKASRTFGRVYLGLELNAQKYLHRYTTWDTDEQAGSDSWFRGAGREDYLEDNTSLGFGETLTLSVSTLPGLDLSAIWGLYQSRHYQPQTSHADRYGSSLLDDPRQTGWAHAYRLVLDATYGLGALPGVRRSPRLAGSLLARSYLSAGYACLAPQLQNGGRERSLNPFNAKYASVYLDWLVVY